MKRLQIPTALFAVLLALSALSPSQAQEIPWQAGLDAALREAERTGRPVIAYVTSNHCPHCTRMERDTLSNRDVQGAILSGFVPLYINADVDAATAGRLGVRGVPSTVIISPERRILAKGDGYVEPKRFLTWLRASGAERR